jgi:hypothetical protein
MVAAAAVLASARPIRPLKPLAPPPGAAPTTPAPDIDFSVIDTPQKAMLLPALAANTFELLLNTTSIAGTSGVTSFNAALSMTMGSATSAAIVHSDTAPTTLTLNGQGTMGNAAFSETWQFNDQGLSIQGTIGSSQENLMVTAGDDGLHIDGAIGSVEVHELLTVEGEDIDQKLIWDGTVGGEKIHQVRSYVDEGRGLVHDHVEGSLGTLPISYDQHITSDDANGISFATQGQMAGVPVQTTQAFVFSYPPDPPPAASN